jgi:hypothetical protein
MLYILRACRRRYPRNNNALVSEREIFGTESK